MHTNHRILSGTATIQFILSSLYIAATFGEVIEGFINHENAPNAAYLYFINPKVKLWLIARGVFFTNVRKIASSESACCLNLTSLAEYRSRLHLDLACIYGMGKEHPYLHPTSHYDLRQYRCARVCSL